MACKCSKKAASPTATVMSGGYTSPTIYTILPTNNPDETAKTITSSGPTFIILRNGVQQTVTPNKFFGLKLTEIAQLQEQEAPIYVYG